MRVFFDGLVDYSSGVRLLRPYDTDDELSYSGGYPSLPLRVP